MPFWRATRCIRRECDLNSMCLGARRRLSSKRPPETHPGRRSCVVCMWCAVLALINVDKSMDEEKSNGCCHVIRLAPDSLVAADSLATYNRLRTRWQSAAHVAARHGGRAWLRERRCRQAASCAASRVRDARRGQPWRVAAGRPPATACASRCGFLKPRGRGEHVAPIRLTGHSRRPQQDGA